MWLHGQRRCSKWGVGGEAWQEFVGQAGAEEKDRCRAKAGSLQFDHGSRKDREQRGKSGVVEGGAGGLWDEKDRGRREERHFRSGYFGETEVKGLEGEKCI